MSCPPAALLFLPFPQRIKPEDFGNNIRVLGIGGMERKREESSGGFGSREPARVASGSPLSDIDHTPDKQRKLET